MAQKNYKIKLLKGLEKEKAIRVIELIKRRLPKNGKILVLSLTGSRAFGWANENYDYDIHGVFAAKNYWDYVHSGEEGFDINLYEFGHTLQDIQYQHFEFFMNISNPFYIHPKFDLKKLMRFCTIEGVKQKRGDILRQVQEFETFKNPRAALHSYRILMVPIYFLKKGKFELNVYKLNKSYKFKQLEKLKIAYTQGKGEWSEKEVKRDLNRLLKEYDRLCQKKGEKLDMEKTKKWLIDIQEKFYRS
jgi:predicted nucleotidyltransferase